MRVAFITEMGFTGKIPADHTNMRTEFAWMYALNADHHPIETFTQVKDYDHVFVIFPKGKTFLSAEGSKLVDSINPVSKYLSSNLIKVLKESNKKVYYVQEGPHWWYNDYEIVDQINFYNMLTEVDIIFTHNREDVKYYAGLIPGKTVEVLPTLMVETLIKDFKWTPEDKAIVGGNFARWYGGFESFIVAQEFRVPYLFGQTSHARREAEDQLINHLPRVFWLDWMKNLATFKYAVHLMPTIAAGTFSLNCSYLGIPCIGNKMVDTQIDCQPDLAVDVHDIFTARKLASRLRDDKDFYTECSFKARENYRSQYSIENWLIKVKSILNEA